MRVDQPSVPVEEGLTARVRRWWDRTVEAWARRIDSLPDGGYTARIAAGLFLLALAIGALVLLNMALRSWGLWGDLAFALVVVTAVLWALYRATRPLLRRNKRFWPFPRALSMAVTLLIGFPLAVATWPVGFVLIAAPPTAWALIALGRWLAKVHIPLPPLWPLALLGVGLALILVAVQPQLSSAEIVPRAVPVAQEEQRHRDLAEQFRPLLFFDMAEQRYPLDVEDAITEGRVQMCRAGVGGEGCDNVPTAAALDDSFAYLEISDAPWRRRGGDERSAIYYLVDDSDPPAYVDYWWFYADNPSPVGGQIFCGPGLRTPPFTCQEHAGDWEGVTVLLGACAAESETCVGSGDRLLEPVAVRYAQHAHVLEYSWERLEELWNRLPRPTSPALELVWEEFVQPAVADHGARPLVFVARNSHASYPHACLGHCRQEAASLPEGRHNGGLPWTHNLACDGCVKPLPLTAANAPATWNAFSGRWGAQRCILAGAYCDFSAAPPGPSHQQRYADPDGPER